MIAPWSANSIFAIPENISVREDPDGIEYENHLLAAPDTGIAKIKLNGWEEALIEEESKRTDFVCWLRNPPEQHGRFAYLTILAARRNPSTLTS